MATQAEKAVIGTREILKAISNGKIKKVVIANNCPLELRAKIPKELVESFDGDEKQLGTRLGKPFPIAMVGYED